MQWAKKTLRDISRTVRRIARIYDIILDENDEIFHVRRLQNNKKKKKKYTPGPQFKHGVQVPQNVEQAIKLDKANGNTAWQDAIEKEMSQLIRLKMFQLQTRRSQSGRQLPEDETPADLWRETRFKAKSTSSCGGTSSRRFGQRQLLLGGKRCER